jgi:uncharacterized circularly permuted ATP-grasp superfamily protein
VNRYEAPQDGYDEALAPSGEPRAHYVELLAELAAADLAQAQQRLRPEIRARGVSFGPSDADAFVVDPVPRVFAGAEWDGLAPGLAQRVRALDQFLRDAYGERRIVAAGVVPDRLVATSDFHEADLDGIELAGPWVGLAGLDVVRDGDGTLRVLEDNVRMPTGPGFAANARELVAPLWAGAPVPREAGQAVIDALGAALRAVAPGGDGDPSIAVLGDRPEDDNHAHWEIAEVARRLGVPMVAHADLEQAEDRLWMRVDGRRRPVDVLSRRSNDHMLRDERRRPTIAHELMLGPLRAGNLALVNPYGAGLADDKLAHVYVEAMIDFYLGEEPLLATARSYDLAEEGPREEVLERLGELVVKPRHRVGGEGVVIGSRASREEREEAAKAIRADPDRYVAQDLVDISTHPTVIDGTLAARHVDLRPVIVGDGRSWTVPGGVSRVALTEGSLVVNMAQGGGVKDVWILD